MDFRTIEVLIWLVKDPNLKRTAERLKVTQPTLTKRLSQLEEDIGQQLFIRRGSQGLLPTPQAIELAASAKVLLDNWSYATNMAKMKSGKKQFFSVNGPLLFMQTVIAPMWAKSSLESPYLIHMQTLPVTEINFEVSGKDLDAAFLFEKRNALDFKFMPICVERMAVIYHKDSPVTPARMLNDKNDGLRWLSYRPDRDPLASLIQAGVLPPKTIAGFFEDLPALLNVVASDPGFATVLPWHSILHRPDTLRALPLEGTEQTLSFVYRPSTEGEGFMKTFGETVIREVKKYPCFLSV